tara:strand:- start:14250 stop:15191 length:942 start_codon:yes stop_codon:yes gene_type:complete
MTKTILVTGADGFIGKHLVRTLKGQDYTLSLMTHNEPSTELQGMLDGRDRVTVGDISKTLTSADAFRDVETVVHLATYANVQKAVQEPLLDFAVSQHTATLLDRMKAHEVPNFLFFSAGRVYGTPQREVVNETHPLEPIEPYGAGKLFGETQAKLYARHGIQTTSLRVFSIYGPGQRAKPGSITGVVAIFAEKLLEEQPLKIYGDGSLQRNFLHVQDLASLTTGIIEKGLWGETLNVASDTQVTIKELAETLGEVIGVEPTITYEKAVDGDIPCIPSIEKLKRTFSPLNFTPFKKGLKNYVTWLRTDREGDIS